MKTPTTHNFKPPLTDAQRFQLLTEIHLMLQDINRRVREFANNDLADPARKPPGAKEKWWK